MEELLERKAELESQISNWEPDQSEYEEQYCDMLDECYPAVFGICPSRILKECDPIAYNCGLSDYVDGLDLTPEELEAELAEIEAEIEELEAE